MTEIMDVIQLNNYLVDFCRKFSKRYGDCEECPISKKIHEHCKVDGLQRWLSNLITNWNKKGG